MESVVQGMLRLEVSFDAVLHSPWTRARQTAALLEPLVRGETLVCAALARGPDDGLLAELRQAAGVPGLTGPTHLASFGPRLAVVGHQPWLGELVAWLTLGDRAAGGRFLLGKASVAWLAGQVEPAGMELKALLPASVLRELGSRPGKS